MAMTSEPGEREPAPIVFVHGDFADGVESWSPVLAGIGSRFRSIVIDRPGFGEAISDQASFTIAGDARYVLEVADDLGLASFHLVGHSYGGLVAIEIAASRPGTTRSLHLVEPPLLDLLPEDPLVQELDRRAQEIQAAHRVGHDEETAAAFFAAIGAGHVVERLHGTPEWQRVCAHASRFARSEPARAYPRTRLDQLAAETPVALYTGGRSHPALRATAAALAARIDRARVIDVADAGHAVQLAGAAFLDPLLELIVESETECEGERSVPLRAGSRSE
jgi:pimeloyl-ACP methyl ester carboxylesterase